MKMKMKTKSPLKKGFDRLRGVAAAGLMGVGALAGGSARAAVTGTSSLYVTKTVATVGTVQTVGYSYVAYNGTAWPVSGSTTLNGMTITSGAMGISEAWISGTTTGGASASAGDAFDGGLGLWVDGVAFNNPDSDVDLTGDIMTSDTVTDIIAGIDASVQYYFSPNRAVVRALYTLTNTSGATIDTAALVGGNFGSDSDTTVQATQSGDTTIDTNDMWMITDDDTSDSDPVITTTRYGSGASVMPLNAAATGELGDDAYGSRYNLTIAAGATQRVMVFHEFKLPDAIAASTTAAADFESLTALQSAGLLSGIDADMQSEIVNYGNSAPTVNSVTIGDDNGGSAVVGDSLSGSYTYFDFDGDTEGTTTYRWLRNGSAISGATASSYTMVTDDAGQTITFEVTPVAATGLTTGSAVTSSGLTVDTIDAEPTSDAEPASSGGGGAIALPGLFGLGLLALNRRRKAKIEKS